MSRAPASRYQSALVVLHWLVAAMILSLLCLGFFVLATMPNTDPNKLKILVWHMSGGMAVLALMIVRVIVRLCSARPAPATIGRRVLDRFAPLAHWGLYAVVLLMILTGWLTGYFISGAFAPGGPPLSVDFAVLPTFRAHAALAVLLTLLIAGHIAAALYHQFVLKDALLRRMGFGKRTITR
jgi:cytochrome b561